MTIQEHYAGKWPFFLSPRQAMVVPVSKAYEEYAQKVQQKVRAAGFFVDVDVSLDQCAHACDVAKHDRSLERRALCAASSAVGRGHLLLRLLVMSTSEGFSLHSTVLFC